MGTTTRPWWASGRSLLSELLSSDGAALLKAEAAAAAQFDTASEASDDVSSLDGSLMDWEGSWFERTPPREESDRSSQCSSQPIPIPAVCYFKDEVQRAALDKLNQKRKWYQQQLEAERMMSRSIAKSKQAAAAARANRPTGRPGAPN